MRISIVIPAYNEEAVIGDHIEGITAFADGKGWDYELVVVDDGSADRTAEIVAASAAAHPRMRLVRLDQNRGKGHAVRTGLLAGTGDVRGFTDADASTPVSELDRVLAAFEDGAQVVIGSRAKRAEDVKLAAQLHRKLIGRVFNTLLRVLVGLRDRHGVPISDTQCGFKWFSAAACKAILPEATLDGFAFDVELLYLAGKLGFPIEELPVNWEDRGVESSVNLLTDPLKMLWQSALVPLKHRGVGR